VNIFILDNDPLVAARMHCDQHVSKMHTEGIQMLVSMLQRYNVLHDVRTVAGTIHRGGYANHPCTRWVGDSVENYKWTAKYVWALAVEHRRRFGKTPASMRQLYSVERAANTITDHVWLNTPQTPYALAMPDSYHGPDAVAAYRAYYIGEKSGMARWAKNVQPPTWYRAALGEPITA
jgi:hypothetical protein